MDRYAIRVHNLSKKYRIGQKERYRMLRDVMLESAATILNVRRVRQKGSDSSIWALKNVSFALAPGDSLGIIGNNGAGKSTLLKILSRITAPTEGFAHLRGRVGSLLEVGTGFHPELTGRENVYLNGAVLGMRKTEIDRKFDQIVAFSEVEQFLETPVKFYSSGMRVRLAFSVAAHLEPEILLIDEVLAVGDIAFQKKSINRMEEVTRDGRSVIFVSHNMAAMRSLCKTGIYLNKGEVQFAGEINQTVDAYLNSSDILRRGESHIEIAQDETLPVQFLSAAVLGPDGMGASAFSHEQPFTIEIRVAVRKETKHTYLKLSILDHELKPVLASYDFEQHGGNFRTYRPGTHLFQVNFPPILAPGEYRLSLQATQKSRHGQSVYHSVDEVCPFELVDSGSSRSQSGLHWEGSIATLPGWNHKPFNIVDDTVATAGHDKKGH